MTSTVKVYGMGKMQPDHVIEDMGTVEVFLNGLKVSIGGAASDEVRVSVSPFGVRDPGGPDRLLSEVALINQMQSVTIHKAVDGELLRRTELSAGGAGD